MKQYEVSLRETLNGVRHICLFADSEIDAENKVKLAYKNTYSKNYNDIVNIIEVRLLRTVANPRYVIPQIKRIVNSTKDISKTKAKIIKNNNIEFYENTWGNKFDGTNKSISFIPYDMELNEDLIKDFMNDLYFLYENDVILETEIGFISINNNMPITATGFNFDGLYETNISLFGKDGTVYSNY